MVAKNPQFIPVMCVLCVLCPRNARVVHKHPPKTPSLDSIHGTAAHSHPFRETPLHTKTKAAVFLPSQIFKKGL